MMIGNETFKTVISNGKPFNDYQVSDQGNIFSLKNNRLLKPYVNSNGHLQIGLCENGKVFRRQIHRIVLETFLGQPGPEQECCHSDGDPKNNSLENLRWDTRRANMIDRSFHQTNPVQKLSAKDVLEIKKLLAEGNLLQKEIAEKYGVGPKHISMIKTGKKWSYLKD